MFSLALIIFVVSEKKAFEHFLIGSNANLFPAVATTLDFDWHKQHKFCRGPSTCSLEGPLQSLGFLFRYEIQNGGYGRTYFNNGPYEKNVSKRFFSETTWTVETKLHRNNHWKVLSNFFYADRKSKMAATAGNRLTLDPMGNCSNAFFSETTNMIKAKLYMNVHWMVLYKL
jgi:hypothetical protein